MMGDERLKATWPNRVPAIAAMSSPILPGPGKYFYPKRTACHRDAEIADQIPTLDQLGLPRFSTNDPEKNGIIFITGATGSGKTTTLAAMLNELNETQKIHILTLEDRSIPPSAQAGALQPAAARKDFRDFASGLRAALRQAPKVILVGEIRDRETMESP